MPGVGTTGEAVGVSNEPIVISKALPALGGGPVPDGHIEITAEIPGVADLQEWDAFCVNQARQIEYTLLASLPGETYDRLLGLMLARRASHFRVPHERGETT